LALWIPDHCRVAARLKGMSAVVEDGVPLPLGEIEILGVLV
jgi:hypothetical protein